MDKNQQQDAAVVGMESIKEEMGRSALNIILCSEAFGKTRFLGMLADCISIPVVFVDTDLLYAGYVEAGMHKRHGVISVFCPDRSTWHDSLAEIISMASATKTAVIIDSLNGVYEMFREPADAVRSANTCIMALSSLAWQAGSSVTVGATAKTTGQRASDTRTRPQPRPESSKRWVTNPGGRQIIQADGTNVYVLQETDSGVPVLIKPDPAPNTRTAL